MSCVIRINKFSIKEHVEYSFLVISEQNEGVWHFSRRYSVIRRFHEQLAKTLHMSLPPFPPKKFCGNNTLEFLERRKKELQQYFAAVSKLPGVVNSKLFKSFIKPPDKVLVENPKESKNRMESELEIHRQLENYYAQVVEDTTNKMLDLNIGASPFDQEDLAKRQNELKNLTSFKLKWGYGVPEFWGSIDFLKNKTPSYSPWLDTKFQSISETLKGFQLESGEIIQDLE